MSLTPTQLQELQTIVETLRTEFPNSDDDLWQAAIRIQKAGLGPVTGTGGQPAFDAAVADIVEESEQISTVQGKQGGLGQSVDVAVFNVVPIEGELPAGSVGDTIYIDTAPNTYLATDVVSLTPAGPNSVILSEVGTQVARTVAAASGGMEVNNLSTGGGFERVLTVSDMGGAGITIEDEGAPLPGLATTLDFVGAGVTATGAGATKTITIPGGASVAGADTEVQFNDGGAFGASANFTWDDNTLAVTNVSSAAPALQLNVGNNPSAAIQIDSTLSTNYVVLRMNDQTGGNFFLFRHDYSLSTPNHEFILESSAFGDIIEIENEGNVYIGGNEASALLKVFAASTPNRVKIDGNATQRSLYFEEKPAASSSIASEGQIWVRNDTPNVLVFTDDAGNDIEISNSVLPVGTSVNSSLRWDGSSWVENLGVFLNPTGSIFLAEKNVAVGAVAGFGQIWVAQTVPTTLFFSDDAGADFEVGVAVGTPVNNYGAFWTGNGGGLSVETNVRWTGTELQIRSANSVVWFDGANSTNQGRVRYNDVQGLVMETTTARDIYFARNLTRKLTLRNDRVDVEEPIFILEAASAAADVTGYGQIWVRNDSPNRLFFTDDAGNDIDLTAGASPAGANSQIQYNDAGAFGADAALTFDDSNIILEVAGSQARIVIDETDGGGDCRLQLTDTTTADGGAAVLFDGTVGALRLQQTDDAGNLEDLWVNCQRNGSVALYDNGVQQLITESTGVTLPSAGGSSLYLGEKANANADVAGQGQLWVRNDAAVPALMYTDDSGNDYQVSGNFLSQRLAGSVLLSGTSFSGVLNAGPKGVQYYSYIASFEVTAPAADDIKIQLTFDTAAYFQGVVTWAGSGITNGSEQLEGQTGDVTTNTVVIPTSGVVAQGGGTFVTIVGTYFHNSGGPTTFSLRVAKNADTGADGFIRFAAAHFLTPWGPQTNP